MCESVSQVELQIGLKDYDTQRDKRFAGEASDLKELSPEAPSSYHMCPDPD